MCGHQSSDHGRRNNGRNFCKHPIWGCLRPFWDKIWPKYKISGTILNDPVKHPRWLNLLKMLKKGLGAVFAPTGTLRDKQPNPQIWQFSPLNLQSKTLSVPYGCIYSPQALFLKIFGFFEENKTFFIPRSPSYEKNSMVYVGSKLASKSAQSPI